MDKSPWASNGLEPMPQAPEMTPMDYMQFAGRELTRQITNTSIDVAKRFPPKEQMSIQLAFTCNLMTVLIRGIAQAKDDFEMKPIRDKLIWQIKKELVDD